MFQDEARFGRFNDVRRCWAPKPVRPLCTAMLTYESTYAYAAVEALTGEMDTLILPQVNRSIRTSHSTSSAKARLSGQLVMLAISFRAITMAYKCKRSIKCSKAPS
jgi:hypothetical protein